MIGLAKIAGDYREYYANDPELRRLRDEDVAASNAFDKVDGEYQSGARKSAEKGGLIGFGAAGIPSGLALALATHDRTMKLPVGLVGGAIGGAFGGMAGSHIGHHHFTSHSPLTQQRLDAMNKAQNAQDAHLNRWLTHDDADQGN